MMMMMMMKEIVEVWSMRGARIPAIWWWTTMTAASSRWG
jgi:hypothetical protein